MKILGCRFTLVNMNRYADSVSARVVLYENNEN